MSYIEQTAIPGERVMYSSRIHWIVMWPTVLFFLIALVGLSDDGAKVGSSFTVFMLLGILSGLSGFINMKFSEVAVTNRRVVIKAGLISRKSLELLLPKVESIHVDQSVLGRIIGFGTITVIGTGGTKEVFKDIDTPIEFRRMVQEQVATMHWS